MTSSSDVNAILDPSLADEGLRRIEWAAREMPVLRTLRDRFAQEKPFQGLKISACLHVTTETANLALALKEGGAQVALCASNPLSTQDDVAAALVETFQLPTFAIKGEDTSTYYNHILMALSHGPHITLDDGADLVSILHTEQRELLSGVFGGTEETTTGVIRLRNMANAGKLEYPIIAVNEADTKHMFDNRYGTGQSTLDGIIRATNVLFAGKYLVIAGYGWCGRGVAMRANGLGAKVIVTEVDPIRALEATMDGHQVMRMEEAAKIGDIFVTVTGGKFALNAEHFQLMKDDVLVANSGHFNVEINIDALEDAAVQKRRLRPMVEQFVMNDGRRINLLAEGRLVNLSAAEGHPSAVMDMSFANQALSVEYLVKHAKTLAVEVYDVPVDIDREVATLKLHSMGLATDKLTDEQNQYLLAWETGT